MSVFAAGSQGVHKKDHRQELSLRYTPGVTSPVMDVGLSSHPWPCAVLERHRLADAAFDRQTPE